MAKSNGGAVGTQAQADKQALPRTMRAAAIDRFGGLEALLVRTVDVPGLDADEILIRVECAGVGVWDPFEREGGFAQMYGAHPQFPYTLGSDGAGTVAAVGRDVKRFKVGDRVYGVSVASPKGGFYAEFAAVKADNAAIVPDKLTTEEAGVMGVDAITALQGLLTAGVNSDEAVLVFGASGGVGHLAVQLAKLMGARVLAVASGDDGVELARRLGADVVVEGHSGDVAAAARELSPRGLDAALVLAGGESAQKAIAAVRSGGRIAYPNGVEPAPQAGPGQTVNAYNGEPGQEILEKLNDLIESGPFQVHVARTFSLDQAADAQRALESHFLGKLGLNIT